MVMDGGKSLEDARDDVDPQSDCSFPPFQHPPDQPGDLPTSGEGSFELYYLAYITTDDPDDDQDMPGPTRTRTSRQSSSSNLAGKPPRPPNAWILYRSEKMREIPKPGPGEQSKPQADISKAISAMWRNEPAEVRAHYERASEIKKAEHMQKYPGYRFQPLKREEKERLREEKKQEKEQAKQERLRAKGSRTVSGSSYAPRLSDGGSASATAKALYRDTSNLLAPYLNLSTTPAPRVSQNTTTTIEQKPSLSQMSQSNSSSDPLTESLCTPSTSSSSPQPIYYPPPPVSRSVPTLETPLPSHISLGPPNPDLFSGSGDLDAAVQDAVRRFELAQGIKQEEPSFHDASQDFVINLPDPSFPGFPWNTFENAGTFTFEQTPDGFPTWTASGDPNQFDLGELNHYFELPTAPSIEPLLFSAPGADYTNFLVDYAAPQHLNSRRNAISSGSGLQLSGSYKPVSQPATPAEHPYATSNEVCDAQSGANQEVNEASFESDTVMTPFEEVVDEYADCDDAPVSPINRIETASAPPSTTAAYNPPAGASNSSSRRVGGDWRRAFQQRIPSN